MSNHYFAPKLLKQTLVAADVPHSAILMSWLGGPTFNYQLSWYKNKPIKLSLQTKISSFFELAYQPNLHLEHCKLHSNRDFLSQLALLQRNNETLFCEAKNMDVIQWYHIKRLVGNQVQCGNRRYYADAFTDKWPDRTIWMLNRRDVFSSRRATRLALQRIVYRFLYQQRGPSDAIYRWQLHLRQPSLRKSWQRAIATPSHYFDVAVQLFRQLTYQSNGAYREDFVSCLSHCASFLDEPDLAIAANPFRLVAEQWRILGELLISVDELGDIRTMIQQGKYSKRRHQEQQSKFSQHANLSDFHFRLRVMEDTLQKIQKLECQGFSMIDEVLGGVQERGALVS